MKPDVYNAFKKTHGIVDKNAQTLDHVAGQVVQQGAAIKLLFHVIDLLIEKGLVTKDELAEYTKKAAQKCLETKGPESSEISSPPNSPSTESGGS